jgi:hypothetical protein
MLLYPFTDNYTDNLRGRQARAIQRWSIRRELLVAFVMVRACGLLAGLRSAKKITPSRRSSLLLHCTTVC